ncbi:multidrug resistance protein [Lasallia pustulata]|uniref:Multidrug resistance protein n=1 Tax=Lasallia pustulata TaxID=136370 RepID=A0A1W5D0B7_9LECA|nr:multidrug resistance protein [Lasallia pustulata]
MAELMRDTLVGDVIRILSGRRLLPYAEEKDPSLWKRYINREKTDQMAHHGHIQEETEEEQEERSNRSRSSESTALGDEQPANVVTGHVIDKEKGRDINVVHWYGDDDPEAVKKVFVTAEICLLTTSVYIGSAIYTPGIEEITHVFGVSPVKATLGLTLFVAGYGLGPMLWAPLSEIPQIGRNPIYLGTLFVFVVLQLAVALAPNFATLLVFRFITGFFGSPVLATGGASIGDIYRPMRRAYPITIWGVAAVCGPVLGPLVGGFAAQAKGWKWTIWELTWLSGACFVLLIFFLPETSSSNILYRRSRRLRKLTGNINLKSEGEIMGESMTGKDVLMVAVVRPFTLSFTEPMVFLLNLYIALIYGLLYIWFESFPIVFEGIYGFNLGQEGLAFIGLLVGAFVAIPPFFWYLHKYTEPKFNEDGELKPEERLPPAFVGAFCIPICLFWFGWTSRPAVHWVVPIIGSSFFTIGALLMFNAVLNYLGKLILSNDTSTDFS